MKKKLLLIFASILVSNITFGQTKEDVKKITASYDFEKLKAKAIYLKNKAKVEKEKAIAIAKDKNWPLTIDKKDGGYMELIRIAPDGLPIYYATDNLAASRSTRTNFLNSGGALGLSLDGQGMTVRVWDGGNVRSTHNAFGGRVTVVDNPLATSNILHATHVTGTMIANGSPSNIKGMAPSANARTFDWNSDESEAISEAMEGMLISNHSYGVPINATGTPLPADFIGSYTFQSYIWDDIAYEAPYYLPVMSAGNDGQNNGNSDPIQPGYDKLTTNKTSKNILTVANCQDVQINATTGNIIGSININSASSQGPTDDYRVKPDITGNGTDLTSTSNASNTATASLSGTSMSSPNVAGSLILLQQHYKNLHNRYMRASTLKGLACHTADDAGTIGPDAIYGWGLLNCKKAAETLTNNGLNSWVSEENLMNGETFSINVIANGTSPLIASICWTDLPGPIYNGGLEPNISTPVLINDLDIRITRNEVVSFPWKLNQVVSQPAIRNQDNNVDNVEQVKIDSPVASGQYTITVTHKGNLINDAQKYGLVITGLSSNIALTSTSDDLEICANQNAVYTFRYTQSTTSSGATTFSAVNLPAGANVTFSPTSLSANGNVTMTISGLNNVTPNEYRIGIRGTNNNETETRYKTLKIFNPIFTPAVLQSPTNGQLGLSTSVILKWQDQSNAMSYRVQVADTNSFANIVADEVVMSNEYNVSGLNEESRYYWRVIPDNTCGDASINQATIFSFVTGTLICDLTFTAEDYSNAFIDVVPNSTATVPLTIEGGFLIGDINVNLDISHTWIGDIEVTLQGPASIGSPIITLFDQPCGDNQNILCTVDDQGNDPSCSGIPSITGNVVPISPLSALNSLPADGEWTLTVKDAYNEDGGSINLFSIDLCRVLPFLNTIENPIERISIFPNPSNGFVSITIPELTNQATIYLFDMQGRKVLTQSTNQVNTNLDLNTIQDGVYLITIENDFGSISKKIVLRKN